MKHFTFLPAMYKIPIPPNPLILPFAPVSGGPCHFKKNSLSPYSGKPVGDSTKTQYYLAIRIMIEKVLVCSIKHLEDDLVALRNLKIRILGLGYKDTVLHIISTAGLIALFQTLAVLVVL